MSLLVTFSAAANRDLEKLFNGVAKIATSPVAEDYVARVVQRCLRIGDFPTTGSPRPELGRNAYSVPFERKLVICYVVRAEQIRVFSIGREPRRTAPR